ncbi:MAG: SCO family protein [Acidiferrobacterales bacterium]|nr:SCO family protein [Acidiferrobacterales bacterium]
MPKSKKSIPIVVAIAIAAIIAGIFAQQSQQPSMSLPAFDKAVILPTPKPINYVDFVDHNGNLFNNEHLLGYWNILFFGFTNCPDICPTTMHTLKQVKQKLNEQNKWGNYRVILVSVDPARDTQERLANYVPYYDQEFIGLRGDLDITTQFAKQLGILFVQQEAADGYYQVDHGASLILVNPRGEMAGVITAPHHKDQISQDLILLADYFAADHQDKPTTTIHSQIADNNHTSHSNASHSIAPMQAKRSTAIGELDIVDAWIRPAPPTANSMAAYLTLKNTTNADIEIVGVRSQNFSMAMIHDTIMENGIAKMQHLDKLIVPAGGEITLAPLAKHLMLMQPHSPLTIGDIAQITLIASDGSQLTQNIEVKQKDE